MYLRLPQCWSADTVQIDWSHRWTVGMSVKNQHCKDQINAVWFTRSRVMSQTHPNVRYSGTVQVHCTQYTVQRTSKKKVECHVHCTSKYNPTMMANHNPKLVHSHSIPDYDGLKILLFTSDVSTFPFSTTTMKTPQKCTSSGGRDIFNSNLKAVFFFFASSVSALSSL